MITESEIHTLLLNIFQSQIESRTNWNIGIGVILCLCVLGASLSYFKKWKMEACFSFTVIGLLAIAGLAINSTAKNILETTATERAKRITEILNDPKTKVLSANISENGEISAVVGWYSIQKTEEITVLGQTTPAQKLIQTGQEIQLSPKIIAYLSKKNFQIAGLPIQDAIAKAP